MQLLERRIGSGDRTLVVLEGGDPAGAPVLVHHETPGSALLDRPHLEDALARRIRLIGYSRPGCGGSTRAPGRSVADAAADVVAIADALGLDRLAVVGASGGGVEAHLSEEDDHQTLVDRAPEVHAWLLERLR